ncbi:hypothetical protein SAMN04488542_11287 [Fontibacillus panacisegetis]|uniref:Uncharacterized protein n=1 Tax=Fontibacillus panacisegetis TaxID=670482 RepID=A0A1G7LW34_9BACL|nr:hypothetical protein SAMN04488542_11287 [Fontibacillus panacisegetis]
MKQRRYGYTALSISEIMFIGNAAEDKMKWINTDSTSAAEFFYLTPGTRTSLIDSKLYWFGFEVGKTHVVIIN